jgi:hypothetical protein
LKGNIEKWFKKSFDVDTPKKTQLINAPNTSSPKPSKHKKYAPRINIKDPIYYVSS